MTLVRFPGSIRTKRPHLHMIWFVPLPSESKRWWLLMGHLTMWRAESAATIFLLHQHRFGVYTVCMADLIRVNYHLATQQLAALRKRSKETGLTVADLIRRAIDAYLKRTK
jgi:hypothetical protein